MGFPGRLAGKESTCNAGVPSLIPGWRSFPGEGIGYPLQYSWISLVAQMIKESTCNAEDLVRPLGGEDPLEEGMASHSGVLAWRSSWTEEPGGL